MPHDVLLLRKSYSYSSSYSFSDVRTADDEYEYDDEDDCHPSCCPPERTWVTPSEIAIELGLVIERLNGRVRVR